MDDGWFIGRDDARAASATTSRIQKSCRKGRRPGAGLTALGLDFGIWFEPEAVNPKSRLCRAPGLGDNRAWPRAAFCRNELLLDLTRPEVRYIVDSVGGVLDSRVSYVRGT